MVTIAENNISNKELSVIMGLLSFIIR